MSHTSEPWHDGFSTNDGFNICAPITGMVIAVVKTEEDRRRIVACVNACSKMSTAYLEQCGEMHRNDAGESIVDLIQQRDELLAALKEIVFVTSPDPDDGSFHENAYSVAINAIAKVEAA